jgi:hypothetical protein
MKPTTRSNGKRQFKITPLDILGSSAEHNAEMLKTNASLAKLQPFMTP